MTGMFKRAMVLGLTLLTAGIASQASAEKYPARPIRIISSTPAGGPQDAMARLVAQYLNDKLDQPVIVENRPGANTIIAAQAASVAPPDGYTLLMATDSTLSINPHLYSRLSYNAADFEPIVQMVEWGSHMFVNAELPVHSLREFIDYAKSRPGKLNYGSYGHGSNPHLAAEQLKLTLGIDLVHIPFKGSADSMAAFAANQVQMMVTSVGSTRALVSARKIRPIATSGVRRTDAFPDTPTFAESGFPTLNFTTWFGLVAPKGTPQPIIDLLAQHVRTFVTSEQFRKVTAPRYAWDVVESSPAQFAAFLKADREGYRRLIEQAGVARIN